MKNRIIENLKSLDNQKKQHLLLAISGGIDSMVMLDFFHKNPSLSRITACYINHNSHSNSKKWANSYLIIVQITIYLL